MSVTIRLSRTGRKNQPTFKLVVSNTRDKRNGKYVDILGYYNPFDPKQKFSYDKEKMEKWKKQGAFITTAVSKLIDGKYEYEKYDPKKIKEEKEKKAQEEKTKGEEEKMTEEKQETAEEKIIETKEQEVIAEDEPAKQDEVKSKEEAPANESKDEEKGE